MVAVSLDSKAAEDRHTGFRWLCRAARLEVLLWERSRAP
jgi:hypothetical protein